MADTITLAEALRLVFTDTVTDLINNPSPLLGISGTYTGITRNPESWWLSYDEDLWIDVGL